MEEKINSIKKNDIWELSKFRKGHDANEVKWVFKFKKKIAKKQEVELVHVKTQNQVAYIFTKPSCLKILEDWEQDLKCRKII